MTEEKFRELQARWRTLAEQRRELTELKVLGPWEYVDSELMVRHRVTGKEFARAGVWDFSYPSPGRRDERAKFGDGKQGPQAYAQMADIALKANGWTLIGGVPAPPPKPVQASDAD